MSSWDNYLDRGMWLSGWQYVGRHNGQPEYANRPRLTENSNESHLGSL